MNERKICDESEYGKENERKRKERSTSKKGRRQRKKKQRGYNKNKMKETGKGVGKIIFWNVAGIKNKDDEFWEFLGKYDVIVLLETWLEEKGWEEWEEKMPTGWNWRCKGARRESKKGRAMGGIIIGLRKGIEETAERTEKDWLMESRIIIGKEKWRIIAVYNNRGSVERTREIEKEVEEGEEENIVIGGDFNARIGEKGELGWSEGGDEESERKSMDKIQNKEGNELLRIVEEKGWCILNGNKEGDMEGHFTYERGENRSVIDYGIVNIRAWDKIDKFKVIKRVDSDHHAITVGIEGLKGYKDKERDSEDNEGKEYIQDWSEEGKKEYSKSIEEVTWEKNGVEEEWTELKDKIKWAVKKRERTRKKTVGWKPWWDSECWIEKRKLRQLVKRAERGDIKQARIKYKKLCEKKIEEWKQKEEESLKEIKTEVEAWKYVNRFRKRKREVCKGIRIEEWKRYFMELLGGTEVREERYEDRNRVSKEKGMEEDIEEMEVRNQINRLKKGKAAGGDEIRNEAWMAGGGKTGKKLVEIIRKVWKGEGIPQDWREGIIVPIKKRGDGKLMQNYRGITLSSTGEKIYAGILNNRVIKEADRVGAWSKTQFGFRKGKGSIDCIKIVKHVIGRRIAKKKGKMYMFFVDLKAAFDNVDREKLWEVLRKRKINEELIEKIKELYRETSCRVRVGKETSEPFWFKKGVRQGCPLSPTLFNLYISDIGEELDKGPGGIKVGKERICSIEYADDLVLLAETQEGLSSMIRGLGKILKEKKLQLNVEKSKVMVCKKGGGEEMG